MRYWLTKPLWCLLVLLILGDNIFAQEIQEIDISQRLNEELNMLPKEPKNVMACLNIAKKYRREVIKARNQKLPLFETSRKAGHCKKVKEFDEKTEELSSSCEISGKDYDSRKIKYKKEFDLHCNEQREIMNPPEGLFDLYHFLNKEISRLEDESLDIVGECEADGACLANRCPED